MAKKPRKPRLPDPSEFAFAIARIVTGEAQAPPAEPEKDPAAIARGTKGGKVGGKSRAAKMTAAERSASAKKAATARWNKG